VDACEPPRRLLLTIALGQPDEDVIEVTLAAAAGSQVGRPLDGQAETLASGAGAHAIAGRIVNAGIATGVGPLVVAGTATTFSGCHAIGLACYGD
jgi:hypothetical protein